LRFQPHDVNGSRGTALPRDGSLYLLTRDACAYFARVERRLSFFTPDFDMDTHPDDSDTISAPIAPTPPEAGECCQSGCEPCVYDRYWDALDSYEKKLAEWREKRSAAAADAPVDKPEPSGRD
jgi:hypothetical protein